MKKLSLLMLSLILCVVCSAKGYKLPEYNIQNVGQGTNGAYLVMVTATFKDAKNRQDELKMCAVHGVMFRGLDGLRGLPSQKPLIPDVNTEDTKADFFNAFFSEGKYRNYCALRESSMQSVKIKGGYEISVLILVEKERLLKYLEESGIIQGFSNLW